METQKAELPCQIHTPRYKPISSTSRNGRGDHVVTSPISLVMTDIAAGSRWKELHLCQHWPLNSAVSWVEPVVKFKPACRLHTTRSHPCKCLLCWLSGRESTSGQEIWVWSLGGEDPLEKEMLPLRYSCLKNSKNRGACWATVHGVAKGRTRLSEYHYHFSLLPCYTACGILAPQQGIEPTHLDVEAWSPNHWTPRQFPMSLSFDCSQKTLNFQGPILRGQNRGEMILWITSVFSTPVFASVDEFGFIQHQVLI